MPLVTGSRLGPYEILAPIGAGGMGEVYKARDTRLDRIVAIKVLPSHLADRPELRQRFEREAKAISSLSHPNICALFDVGHESGVDYLVMEYLEGETLADRLARGALPAEQALRYGIEIAAALDKAHRQGIVHRDLKPGNVILTRTGAKVLDFGLAKVAASPVAGSARHALTSLPTEMAGTSPLTTEGTLLGTFQYMAPEQLEGEEADARSDVFALGSVLYEMATGRPAFQGKSRASLISSIMSTEPQSIVALQPLAPPALDRVIRTCLAKDPGDRVQSAHDVMLQLKWIVEGGSYAGVPAPVAPRRKGRERIAWGVAAAAALSATVLTFVTFRGPQRPVESVRLQITLPRTLARIGSPRISPDGRFVAFNGMGTDGRSMVWLRPMGSSTAEPIPSTDGITARPFWSPDSRFIAFMASGKLKKVAVTGGPVQTICDAPSGFDGTWSRDGLIVFDGRRADPLRSVRAVGGAVNILVSPDSGSLGWPEFLPDGRHMLYQRQRTSGSNEMWVMDLKTGKQKLLGVGGSRVEYSPAGYLMYVKDRMLVAQPFDARSLKVTGEIVPVADRVGAGSNGLADFSVSDNGTLVYYDSDFDGRSLMIWMERSGGIGKPVGSSGDLTNLSLSPDQRRVVLRIRDTETTNRDLWIIDPDRGTKTRFTFDASNDNSPLWSPDGSRIAFSSDRNGGIDNLYQKPSSGAGTESTLLTSPFDKNLTSWSSDGRFLAYQEANPTTSTDIWILPLFGDRKPIPFAHTAFIEGHARFSPDGHWLAYACDESGQLEVYVQDFPGPGGKWQISTSGGYQPTWRADGRELYYLGIDGRLMAVTITTDLGFAASAPIALFNTRISVSQAISIYAPSGDGQRFLIITQADNPTEPLSVIQNWNTEIKRRWSDRPR